MFEFKFILYSNIGICARYVPACVFNTFSPTLYVLSVYTYLSYYYSGGICYLRMI